ncbi:MAG: DUF4249 domain-containing protein [Chryseolinea sp.]
MNKSYGFLLTFLTGLLFVACDDRIYPTLENAEPVYVVDAWITNRPVPQLIKLTRSQPYFETTLPSGVSGAVVTVADNQGKIYSFKEGSDKGTYEWNPVGDEVFGEVGLTYELVISVNGEVFRSTTGMSGAPVVDSLTFYLQESTQFSDDLYLAEFWSTDLPEVGDAYWIKTYKNGQLLNKPSDINLAYDAAFARGSEFSGVAFISPIRSSINPFDEDESDEVLSPYALGDSLYVEINSLSEAGFDFLNEVVIQTDRLGGFAELFATPLANVSTNITNATPNGEKVVGFFNVAAVNGRGRRFKSLDEISRTE